jgi:membrane protein implicated in regulation of membrane protease activity
MYGYREFDIALITLSVAIACCIADCGVGIMFSVAISGAACFAIICIYQLSRLSSTKRSPVSQSAHMAVRGHLPRLEDDRLVRSQDRNPNRGRSTTYSL